MYNLTFGIIIPARYASSRFPGKPLSLIAGKPMIVRTVEAALACEATLGVAVATDDERIAKAVSHLVPVVMTMRIIKLEPIGLLKLMKNWHGTVIS